jgi:hypothetical protein
VYAGISGVAGGQRRRWRAEHADAEPLEAGHDGLGVSRVRGETYNRLQLIGRVEPTVDYGTDLTRLVKVDGLR